MANFEYQDKLHRVRLELISGVARYEIMRKLRNGEYEWYPDSKNKKDDSHWKIIREAADTCKYETAAARDEQRSLHLERYLDLLRRCRSNNDRSNERAVLDSIAKMMGLNEKEKIEIEQVSYKVKLI